MIASQFNYKNRNNKYSSFKWNYQHFDGVNYDCLMGANVDFIHLDVKNELLSFGKWYCQTTPIDALRLDALKHIDYCFYYEWLKTMRKEKIFCGWRILAWGYFCVVRVFKACSI